MEQTTNNDEKYYPEEASQNFKVCTKKRKEQDIYQNKSKQSKKNLNNMIEGTNSAEKIFKCDVCYKSFKVNSNLKQHIESVHAGKRFKCDHCSSSFTQKGHLKTHIESVHEGKKHIETY